MPNGTDLSQMTIEEWLRQAQALGLQMTPTPPAAPKSRIAMALENALLAGGMAGQTGGRDYGVGGAMQGISGMLQLRRQQEQARQAYPGQATGTGLQALERLLNLRKLAQPEKPQEPFASSPLGIYNQMTGEITQPAPAPTPRNRAVVTLDAQGNPVTQIVPDVAGTSFQQPKKEPTTAFQAWRKENPSAPITDWFKVSRESDPISQSLRKREVELRERAIALEEEKQAGRGQDPAAAMRKAEIVLGMTRLLTEMNPDVYEENLSKAQEDAEKWYDRVAKQSPGGPVHIRDPKTGRTGMFQGTAAEAREAGYEVIP